LFELPTIRVLPSGVATMPFPLQQEGSSLTMSPLSGIAVTAVAAGSWPFADSGSR
jgi:hypothetical protein